MFTITHPPGQNGDHSLDDIIRGSFINDKLFIWIKISLNFVPRGPIDNNPALSYRRQAIIWINAGPIYWRIYATLGGEELITWNVTSTLYCNGILWKIHPNEVASSIPESIKIKTTKYVHVYSEYAMDDSDISDIWRSHIYCWNGWIYLICHCHL